MSRRVVVLPAGDAGLDGQAEYGALHASLDTALRFYEAAGTTFEFLAGATIHRPGS